MATITYANIYSAGLGDDEMSRAFEGELATLREQATPLACEHRIDGQPVSEGAAFDRRDPVEPGRMVSQGVLGDRAVVDRALQSCRRALPGWRATPYRDRVAIVRQVIDKIQSRHADLAALISLETGKTRADAVTEVSECLAIVELSCSQIDAAGGFVITHRAPSPDACAEVVLMPYGVFGVIAPFNFPMAIPLGMIVAALLMGNTVVFKPSAITPACGTVLNDLVNSTGLPTGVLNLVHGDGRTGQILADSEVDGIVFTGSAEVGLDLVARLAQPPFARPVIAEMGGKNPAIVTDAAPDPHAAAQAVARSAFGMSGQKCNACSRAIVTSGIYDAFIHELVAVTAELRVGDPLDARAFTGPVISDVAKRRFVEAAQTAHRDGTIRIGGQVTGAEGHFVELTVVDGLPSGHPLTREELFLPIVSVVRVDGLQAALAEANAIRYGLAAGIFSGDESEQEQFLAEIEAGIVFVNNPGGATTGVWPGSQTMSGWKGSGSSGKGGFGPWYLQQFGREQSRTIFRAGGAGQE